MLRVLHKRLCRNLVKEPMVSRVILSFSKFIGECLYIAQPVRLDFFQNHFTTLHIYVQPAPPQGVIALGCNRVHIRGKRMPISVF